MFAALSDGVRQVVTFLPLVLLQVGALAKIFMLHLVFHSFPGVVELDDYSESDGADDLDEQGGPEQAREDPNLRITRQKLHQIRGGGQRNDRTPADLTCAFVVSVQHPRFPLKGPRGTNLVWSVDVVVVVELSQSSHVLDEQGDVEKALDLPPGVYYVCGLVDLCVVMLFSGKGANRRNL